MILAAAVVDPESFWRINIGQVATFLGIVATLATLHTLHFANVKRIRDDADQRQAMAGKVDLMFNWFVKHIINSHEGNERASGGGHGIDS